MKNSWQKMSFIQILEDRIYIAIFTISLFSFSFFFKSINTVFTLYLLNAFLCYIYTTRFIHYHWFWRFLSIFQVEVINLRNFYARFKDLLNLDMSLNLDIPPRCLSISTLQKNGVHRLSLGYSFASLQCFYEKR